MKKQFDITGYIVPQIDGAMVKLMTFLDKPYVGYAIHYSFDKRPTSTCHLIDPKMAIVAGMKMTMLGIKAEAIRLFSRY